MDRHKPLLFAFALLLPLGNKYHQDRIVVVVNQENPIESLTLTELKRIYLGDITRWEPNGHPSASIILIDYRYNSETASEFYKKVMGFSQSRVRLRWIGNMLNGEIQVLPVKIDSEEDLFDFISKHRWAIGFVNLDSFDPQLVSIKVVMIDGKNYSDQDYPLRKFE